MVTWVLYLCIGVLIGGMAGFYFAKMDDLSKKQKQALEDKLKKSEQEFQNYKNDVTSHFKQTATLINQMTESYQKVHEHLSGGVNLLCNAEIDVNRLELKLAPPKSLPDTQANKNEQRKANQFTPEASALTDDKEAPKTTSTSAGDTNNNKNSQSSQGDYSIASKAKSGSDQANSDNKTPASGTPNINPAAPSAKKNQQSPPAPVTKENNSTHKVKSSEKVSETKASNGEKSTEPHVIETMAVAEEIAEESPKVEDAVSTSRSRTVH